MDRNETKEENFENLRTNPKKRLFWPCLPLHLYRHRSLLILIICSTSFFRHLKWFLLNLFLLFIWIGLRILLSIRSFDFLPPSNTPNVEDVVVCCRCLDALVWFGKRKGEEMKTTRNLLFFHLHLHLPVDYVCEPLVLSVRLFLFDLFVPNQRRKKSSSSSWKKKFNSKLFIQVDGWKEEDVLNLLLLNLLIHNPCGRFF